MIEINLLPEEFRVREKKEKTEIPKKKLLIGGAALFSLFTISLFIDYRGSVSKLRSLEKQWAVVQPQAQVLNQLENEITNVLEPEKKFLQRFVTADRPLTHVMEWVSEFLPDSAWLTQIKMENTAEKNNLVVRGLALPTKEASSIEQIENYLNELKKKMPDASLSLTTARQIQDQIEMTQFTAIFEWPTMEKKT